MSPVLMDAFAGAVAGRRGCASVIDSVEVTNLTRDTPRPATRVSPPHEQGLLAALGALRTGAATLPALAPETYARDHAAFETRSDQRTLIAAHLASRLARRDAGKVSLLSVGCGDGTLDAPLAAALADVRPSRAVRYVGVDPFAGSAAACASAMNALRRTTLSAELHVATFAEAPVSGPFDVVTFVHSMYYVPDVAGALRRAHDLLRPGGELIVLSGPRGALNALADVLAPPLEGHRQWFSDDVAAGFDQARLEPVDTLTLDACLDLADASDEVLDFTVQARLTPELRPLVRAYLAAVAVPGPTAGTLRVPHPVDVYRVHRAA